MDQKSFNSELHSFFAGSGKADITPPLGTYINGDFVPHFATNIHDHLFAKALVLKSGETEIVLIVVDICDIPKELADEAKKLITERTSIPFTNILISSTHTHAAPSVVPVYLSPSDVSYSIKLPGLIAEAVKDAKSHLKKAMIGFGKVNVPEHLRCRRYFMEKSYRAVNPVTGHEDQVKTNPFGAENLIKGQVAATDPEVSFMAVRGLDGSWISVLANYSLHYVGDWDNGTISADYYGYFTRFMKEKLNADEDFTGIMSNGTSGDVNIWDFEKTANYPTEKFSKSELIANEIAQRICDSIENLQWQEKAPIAARYEEVMVHLRKPAAEELEKAKEMIRTADFENPDVDEIGLKKIYAREQVLLNELPDKLPFPIQVIKVGNIIIGGLAAEIFSSTGLWLKEHAPVKNYFTISFANGNLGYVPPADELVRGGYETWRSRTSKLEENAESIIKNKLFEIVNDVADSVV